MVHGVSSKQIISIEEAINLTQEDIEENYREYINPQLTRLLKMLGFNKNFVRAKDTIVWDKNGEEYLDFLGAYGALNIGHNNDIVINALESISHMPNLLQSGMHNLTSALARNLANITPGDLKYTFFCNSGAEAVEGALKLAKIATEKSRVIYCRGSFHGKSMGALSVTGRDKYRKYFEPMVPLSVEVSYGDINELRVVLEKYDDIAAFIVEPIQGEGGIIVPPIGYLKRAKELCKEYGVLLIADEIQTGFGRTGYWFACEAEGVSPDIMCVAKALSGGIIPIGAYISNEDVWKKGYGTMDRCLLHTSTFGGNAWASAAGISTIEFILENNLATEALEKGNYLMNKLAKLKDEYPMLKEVRGRGLMIGLEFETINIPLVSRFASSNTIELVNEYAGGIVASELINNYNIITAYTLNNPNVIRIEPPLTVTYDQLDRLVDSLKEILDKNKNIAAMAINNTKHLIKSVFSGRRSQYE